MRYTKDDFREPGGPPTRTMWPRGMPPLRRASKPTTYVGILSVACDTAGTPPAPVKRRRDAKGSRMIKCYRGKVRKDVLVTKDRTDREPALTSCISVRMGPLVERDQ